MKNVWIFLLCSLSSFAIAQVDSRITTFDCVQVLNENHAEALYYYQNNWQKLRELAIEKNYISSFQLLKTESTDEAPFSFVLITTYENSEQYESREDNFGELIKERGSLSLLNDKKPGEFRKIIFSKENVKHIVSTP